MTADLLVPEHWTVTDAGMSYDGIHALDYHIGFDPETRDGTVIIRARDLSLRVTQSDEELFVTHVEESLADAYADVNGQGDTLGMLLDDLEMLGTAAGYIDRTPRTLGELLADYEDAIRAPGDTPASPYPSLNQVDLGAVMRGGGTEPVMLVPGFLVAGNLHWWYGMKESTKTWFFIRAIAELLLAGKTVVWVDKEMYRKDVAHRLLTFGVDVALVDEHLVYLESPPLVQDTAVRDEWLAMLTALRPALVVVDAAQEVLAESDLNEDKSADVVKWASWYLDPARKLGITCLIIDHTGHDGDRPRGASGKGQIAKVEMLFKRTGNVTPTSTGTIVITTEKNTNAAPVPAVQKWRVGGTPFVMERVPDDSMPEHPGEDVLDGLDRSSAAMRAIRDRQLVALSDAYPESLKFSDLRALARGSATLNRDAADSLVDRGEATVARASKGVLYTLVPAVHDADKDPDTVGSFGGNTPTPRTEPNGSSRTVERTSNGTEPNRTELAAEPVSEVSEHRTKPNGSDKGASNGTGRSASLSPDVRADSRAKQERIAQAKELVGLGRSFEEIADAVGVSERTVRRWNTAGDLTA